MDTLNSHPERFVPCPFDSAHSTPAHRHQRHVTICHRNHPNSTKVRCKFDATHFIERAELEHHVATCPSSGNVRIPKYTMEQQRRVGLVSVEEACAKPRVVIEDEDWNGNHPTYDAQAATEQRLVLRSKSGLPKAQRKQFQHGERKRTALLETGGTIAPTTNSNINKQSMDFEKPLRAPKQSSKLRSTASSSKNSMQDPKSQGINKNVTRTSTKSSGRGNRSPKRTAEDSSKETDIKEFKPKPNQENELCEQAKQMNQNNISKGLMERNENMMNKLSISDGNNAFVSIKKEEESSAMETEEQLDAHAPQKKISLRCAANFSAQHKISTGRGFMLASKVRRWEEEKPPVKIELESKDFGYDDE